MVKPADKQPEKSAPALGFITLNSELENSVIEMNSIFKLSILTYNILAQCLVSRDWFPYCDKTSLKWKSRRSLIMEQLKKLDADILCLQEVDHFADFYRGQLSSLGYGTLYYSNDNKRHGCLIAYKSTKLRLGKTKVIEFDDEADYPRSTITGNVGVLAQLITVNGEREFVVGNCHLFWSPNGAYERLRQSLIMTKELAKFKEEHKLPGILCGDFNTQPMDLVYKALTHYDSKTVPMALLEELSKNLISKETSLKQKLDETQSLCATIDDGLAKIKEIEINSTLEPISLDEMDDSTAALKRKREETLELKDELRSLKLQKVKLSAQLENFDALISPLELYQAILEYPRNISCYSSYGQLDSSYACDNWDVDEPKFTNYTDKFKSTLDYIFIPDNASNESDHFSISRLLSLPAVDKLGEGLPDLVHPSDHFPLMACLEWKKLSQPTKSDS